MPGTPPAHLDLLHEWNWSYQKRAGAYRAPSAATADEGRDMQRVRRRNPLPLRHEKYDESYFTSLKWRTEPTTIFSWAALPPAISSTMAAGESGP
jgi:hypothetical protein